MVFSCTISHTSPSQCCALLLVQCLLACKAHITSIAELLGLLLVGTTATLYLGYQLRVARRKKEQQQAEAAKNKAADGGGAEDDAKGFDMRPIEGLKELHEQEMTETR